ncbi:MAG: hypothetical protein AABY22_13195 [Nanoarchaeota archaeon]
MLEENNEDIGLANIEFNKLYKSAPETYYALKSMIKVKRKYPH